MSNYIEYKDKIAFHPGYYVEEAMDESEMSKEDFSKKLGMTVNDLTELIEGRLDLSAEMASKIANALGTSNAYWVNLQRTFNTKVAEFAAEQRAESKDYHRDSESESYHFQLSADSYLRIMTQFETTAVHTGDPMLKFNYA